MPGNIGRARRRGHKRITGFGCFKFISDLVKVLSVESWKCKSEEIEKQMVSDGWSIGKLLFQVAWQRRERENRYGRN